MIKPVAAALALTFSTTSFAESSSSNLFPEVTLFNAANGEDQERLWSQTKLMFGLGAGVIGALYLMPESVTNWDKSEIGRGNMAQKWWDNVRQGPVWDDDHWAINYIGHPYFGGVYYQVARKSGYDQFNSFLYTTLMSTLYWEYGIEAFAEVPSIQDLIVTPIGGWLYGEWAYQTEQRIRAGGGEVMGSTRLGNASLFLLDPVESIGKGINRVTGNDTIKTGITFNTSNPVQTPSEVRAKESYYGFTLHFHY
ncbi:hypothetical protein OAG1_12240 [Agarivorans sp. OAG1]|uniref:DUF3943 domain-containing protein n=1 Tax=Agarivorans sp. OAG1 TaxID=3082387 RepID=UPI002B2CB063|nr:hypothetical protein OAG1_12240 [Agarivorans sp. OAG1]